MRGDQLARQWRVIRSIEASPGGLTVAEIAKREETGIRTIYRDLESLQAAGFPLYTERVDRVNRWAFIDTFKFKIPAPFTLTELMSLYVYKDLVRFLKGTPFFDSLESVFKKIQSTLPPQALRYLERKKLTTEDYSIAGLEDRVAVERKSMQDLFNCCSPYGSREALVRARERFSNLDFAAMVIEGSISKILRKN